MNPKSILIADDEPHMIRVITQFLERAGYRVRSARDGQAALDAIRAEPPDLLLTDINMPRMSGQKLCETLAEQMPERAFPVLVMTSMTDRAHRDWVEAMPEVTLLEKPLSMRQLVAKLEQIFDGAPTGAGAERG